MLNDSHGSKVVRIIASSPFMVGYLMHPIFLLVRITVPLAMISPVPYLLFFNGTYLHPLYYHGDKVLSFLIPSSAYDFWDLEVPEYIHLKKYFV